MGGERDAGRAGIAVDRRGARGIAAGKLDGERPGDDRDAAAAGEAEDGDNGSQAGRRLGGRVGLRRGRLEQAGAGGGKGPDTRPRGRGARRRAAAAAREAGSARRSRRLRAAPAALAGGRSPLTAPPRRPRPSPRGRRPAPSAATVAAGGPRRVRRRPRRARVLATSRAAPAWRRRERPARRERERSGLGRVAREHARVADREQLEDRQADAKIAGTSAIVSTVAWPRAPRGAVASNVACPRPPRSELALTALSPATRRLHPHRRVPLPHQQRHLHRHPHPSARPADPLAGRLERPRQRAARGRWRPLGRPPPPARLPGPRARSAKRCVPRARAATRPPRRAGPRAASRPARPWPGRPVGCPGDALTAADACARPVTGQRPGVTRVLTGAKRRAPSPYGVVTDVL